LKLSIRLSKIFLAKLVLNGYNEIAMPKKQKKKKSPGLLQNISDALKPKKPRKRKTEENKYDELFKEYHIYSRKKIVK